jgi:WhiB family transcriptional regulator, redox-sensing transcriptional regulator
MSYIRQQAGWQSSGACAAADPELFFPLSAKAAWTPQVAQAKEICAGCPVRPECLDFALVHRDVQGIWGGTTEQERKARRRVLTRGRAA